MTTTFKRAGAVLGVVAAGSFALAACSEEGGDTAVTTTAADGSTSTVEVSGNIVAEGASSQQRAMEHFASVFQTAYPNADLSYNATGSGSGQTQFIAGQVLFGGSDSPLSDEQAVEAEARCGGNPAWHLPAVIGPIAVAYNLDGVELNLTTETIAKIFNGDITTWDDAEIAEQNADAELPSTPISVVYRSEESGTSDNFQKFLVASAGEAWPHEASKSFPTAVGQGAQGSAGVVDEVAQIPGAITYVEAGFAEDRDLGITNIDFGHGPVELNDTSVNNALANLTYSGEGNDLIVDADALFSMDEADAYPAVLTVYSIVCSGGYTEEESALIKAFFTTVLEQGQEGLDTIGYIPVSGAFQEKLQTAVDAIQ